MRKPIYSKLLFFLLIMLSSLGVIFAISPFKDQDERLSQLSARLEVLSKAATDTTPSTGDFRLLADIPIPIRTGFPFCETFIGTDPRPNAIWNVDWSPGQNNINALTGNSLTLTSTNQDENGYVFVDIPFSSAFGLKVSFEYSSWGGSAVGADGVSFFMFDGSISATDFEIGGTGGALGYTAVRATNNEPNLLSPGLKGAYLGIGFDELGNFGNSRTGKYGGFEDPNNNDALSNTPLFPHSVIVRGPVDGDASVPFRDRDRINDSKNIPGTLAVPRYESYKFIDGKIFDPASTGIAATIPPVSVAPYVDNDRFEIDSDQFAAACAEEGFRKVFIDLNPVDVNDRSQGYTIEIEMLVNDGGSVMLVNVFDGPIVYNFEAPELLKVGFAAATGVNTNFHEIRNVTVQVSNEDQLEKPLVDPLTEEVCAGESNTFELDVELRNDIDNAFVRCLQLYYTEQEALDVVINDAINIPFPPATTGELCLTGDCNDLLCRPERTSRPGFDTSTGDLAGQFEVFLVEEGGLEVPKVRFVPEPGYSGQTEMYYTVTDNFGQVSDPKLITITINPTPEPVLTTPDPLVWEQQELSDISVLLSVEPIVAGDTFVWFQNGAEIPSETATTYTATTPGDYSVEVTSAQGCVGVAAEAISIALVGDLEPNLSSENEDCLELGSVRVTLNGALVFGIDSAGDPGNEKWRIVDSSGAVIVDWTFLATGQGIIDYVGLPVGDYIFQIGDEFRSGQLGSDGQPLFRHELPFTILPIQDPLLITSVNPLDETCFGQGGSITVSGAGGEGPGSYTFSAINTSSGVSVPPTAVTGSGATFEGLAQGTYTINLASGTRCLVSATEVISGPSSALAIDLIESSGTSCGDLTSGFVTWEVSGGTPGYTLINVYRDGTPLTSPDLVQNTASFQLTNLTIGTYELEVEDANGCTVRSSPVLLEDLPRPEFQLDDAVGCEGEAVVLQPEILVLSNSVPVFTWLTPGGDVIANSSVIDGVTYTISDHDSDPSTPDQLSMDGLDPGQYVYSLAISGANTCNLPDLTATVTVSEFPPVDEVLVDNLGCFEDNSGRLEVSMDASVLSTSFLYELVGISAPQDSPIFNGLAAGSYQIRVINKITSCETLLNDVVITEPALLEVIDLDFSDPTCSSPNGTLTFSVSGGTQPYLVEVNGNPVEDYNVAITGSTYVLQGLLPGDYSVSVVDALNCVASAGPVTLVNDDLDSLTTVDLDEEICFGADVTFTPQVTTLGGFTITWFEDAAATLPITPSSVPTSEGLLFQIDPSDFSLTVSGLSSGNHVFYYRVQGLRLCPDYIFEATVQVFDPINLSAVVTNEGCFGASDGSLTAVASGSSGNFEFSLNGGPFVNTTLFDNLAPGTYSLEARSVDGCATVATFEVEGAAAPLAVNTPDITRASCDLANGIIQNLVISGGWGAYTVEWRKGSQTGPLVAGDLNGATDLLPDTYFLLVTDLNNCVAVFDFEVEESSDPQYALIPAQSVCENEDVTVTPVHLAPDPSLPPAAATEVKWFKDPGQQNEILTGTDADNPAVSYVIDVSDWLNPSLVVSGLEPGTYTYYFYVECTGVELPAEVTVFATPEVVFEVTSISCIDAEDGRISITSGGDPNYVYSVNGGSFVDQATLESTLFPAGTYTISVEQNGVGCPSDLYSVTVLAPQEALGFSSISQTDPTCGTADGSISGEIQGGWSPYTVSLSSSGTVLETQNSADGVFLFDSLLAGSFDVMVTDSRGCELTSSLVTLTFEPTSIEVDSVEVCEGEVAVLIPQMSPFNPNGQFRWYFDSAKTQEIISSPTPAADGAVYQISPTGELSVTGLEPADSPARYFVDVVGTGICVGTTGVAEVVIGALPQVSTQVTNEACFGDGGRIEVTATLGSGAYAYSIDGVNYGNSNVFDVAPGTYSVFVRSQGCVSRLDGVEVLGPDSDLIIDTITSTNPACNTSTGSIAVAFSGGYSPSAYTVTLRNAGVDIDAASAASPVLFENLGEGSYLVEVSDGSCLVSSEVIELTFEVTPVSADDVTICEGDIATLSPSTSQTTGVPSFVWFHDVSGSEPIVNGSSLDGASFTLNAAGELSVSGLTLEDSPKTYYLTVQGAGICSPPLEPVRVNINPIPNLRVSNPSIVCDPDETVDLTNFIEGFNSTIYDYLVEGPSGDVLRVEDLDEVDQSGDYTVQTSFKGLGCWSPRERIRVIIAEELLIADFEYEADLGAGLIVPNAEIQIFEDVFFSDLTMGQAVIWNWDFGDGATSSEQNPTHQYEKKGTYVVTLTTIDQYGCMSEVQRTIEAMDDYLVMIPNAFTPEGVKNQYFKPYHRGIASMEFFVFNTWGELLYESNQLEDIGWDGTLNGSPAIPGNYVYRGTFKTNSGEVVEKSGTFVLIR